MRRIFYAFAAFLMVVSACKKDNSAGVARQLLIGTWNELGSSTNMPTGRYVRFYNNGNMDGTAYPGYSSFEISRTQLLFKGSGGSLSNTCTVAEDSLYIAPADADGCCGVLFARQR